MSENPTVQVKKTEKPWGYELLWAHTPTYVGKVLFIRAGQSLSLQFHRVKEEHIILESGECEFEYGENENELRTMILRPQQSVHIFPRLLHRMKAKTDCRIFEVSTPDLDDVVRLKDNYGRV